MTSNNNWALLDITFTVTLTGVIITIITDIPCHLMCRMTLIEPEKHLKAVLKRGLTTHTVPRFCFVEYEDNEQYEQGDTLFHTFIKEPWPPCQTRWFYFFSTIETIYSPSETAIFKYHNPFPPGPPPSHIVCETNFLNQDNGYIFSHMKAARLFKAGVDFDIAKVGYLLKRVDTPPVPGLVLSLQGVAPGPIPNGHVYSTGLITFPGEMPPDWTWFEAQMSHYNVIAGQYYFYCYWPSNWGPWTHYQRIYMSKSDGTTCPNPRYGAYWVWGATGWTPQYSLKYQTMRIEGYD